MRMPSACDKSLVYRIAETTQIVNIHSCSRMGSVGQREHFFLFVQRFVSRAVQRQQACSGRQSHAAPVRAAGTAPRRQRFGRIEPIKPLARRGLQRYTIIELGYYAEMPSASRCGTCGSSLDGGQTQRISVRRVVYVSDQGESAPMGLPSGSAGVPACAAAASCTRSGSRVKSGACGLV